MNWKDIFVRAAKTAVATFIGAVSSAAIVGFDTPTLAAAGIAAASAAVTVVMNAALQWANQ